jgi:hypothetical protein
MPSYQGQISEQNILQLIAYVKSLSATAAAPASAPPPTRGPVGASAPATEPNRFQQPREAK